MEMKEGMVIELKDDDISESRNNANTENVGINGFDFETEFEFWPIQHPTEPSREDRPVQCPMPHSSHLITDERMQDDRFSDRKRSEASTVFQKETSVLEPPIRTVRKRHHDHTNIITPFLQMPAVSHHQIVKTTVFNKLQHVHRFES